MAEKLTPEEIKKGLECCGSPEGDSCFYCPFSGSPLEYCTTKLHTEAVALINRQQAEIERLQTEDNQFADIGKMYSEIRAEAIKEFVERLQEKADDIGIDEDGFLFTISAEWKTWFRVGDWCEEIIDNIVKEMVGK